MNLHTILIEAVPRIQDELHYINRGGCALFAQQLHAVLTLKGIPSDMVLVRYAGYTRTAVHSMITLQHARDINDVYSNMKAGYSFDACVGHMCVRVGDNLYDDSGLTEHVAISDSINDKAMLNLLANASWNPTFLDSNGIGQEEATTMIAQFLGDVFNNLTESEVVA